MVRRGMMVAIAVGVATVVWPGNGIPQDRAGDAKAIEGLWSGSWGGGERDGVVFQPVIADMVVAGDRVEISGFPQVGRLTGTIRLDTGTKRMRITPAAPAGGRPAPKAIEYAYEVAGDKLTLTGDDKVAVGLQRLPVVQNPLANAQVELVASAGIDDAGDLLVTRYTALRIGETGATYFRPEQQVLSTKRATVLVVQEAGLKAVTVEAARRLVRAAPPVVVTYRQDERPSPPPSHELWKDIGSPPDSEAVRQTFARLLRPGTLVFVLSARENVPRP